MDHVLEPGQELEDNFTGLADEHGVISVAGFGSLLSESSARSTFPDLRNFRAGKVKGYRRIFAHTASVFFQRGIARPETEELSSLSCEPQPGEEIVVSVLNVSGHLTAIQAFLEREHEFKLVAVQTWKSENMPLPRLSNRFVNQHCIVSLQAQIRDDVLPCRVYLRHCVLATQKLGQLACDSFLDHTYLADRTTTTRQYLSKNPGIMAEKPPDSLVSRYSG